jgi:hypothetical protein
MAHPLSSPGQIFSAKSGQLLPQGDSGSDGFFEGVLAFPVMDIPE